MTIKTNTFEGGTPSGVVSVANSGGASGDAWDIILLNNSSAPSGNSNCVYSTAAAVQGTLGCRITLQAAASYLRWNVSEVATRFVARRSFKMPSLPSASTTLLQISNGSITFLYVDTTGKIGVDRGGFVTGSLTASALSAGVQYWLELAMVKETGGGGNGQIEYKIFDNSGGVVATYASAANKSTGTGDASQYRFGGATTASGWTYDDLDTCRCGPVAGTDTWIGPIANAAPTTNAGPDQNVTAGATVNLSSTSSDTDGSIASEAWTYVSAASTGSPSLTGGTTSTPSFTAGSAGNLYTLLDTVTDNGSATGTDTVEVRVPLPGGTNKVPLAIDTLASAKVGTWTKVGGVATEGGTLAVTDDTKYLESDTLTASEQKIRFRHQPSHALATGKFTLKLGTDTGTANVTVRLYDGTTLRQTWTQAVTSTPTNYDFTLSAPTIAAIVDPGSLWAEVGATT